MARGEKGLAKGVGEGLWKKEENFNHEICKHFKGQSEREPGAVNKSIKS